jgi:hypothetical protein
MSPCDFFLFPKLKFHPKVRHFETVDNTQKVVTDKHFHMTTSSTATGSRNVSGGFWPPKETTLKGMMLIFSSVVN